MDEAPPAGPPAGAPAGAPARANGRQVDTAVCCSGGGIRSATYCLGALQALAADGRMRAVDLVTAVSGGSYLAAAWALQAERASGASRPAGRAGYRKAFSEAFKPGSAEESRLRDHTHYLIPDAVQGLRGIMSLIWGAIGNLLLVTSISYVVLALDGLLLRAIGGVHWTRGGGALSPHLTIMPLPVAPFEVLITAVMILRNHEPEPAAVMAVVRPSRGSRGGKQQHPRQGGHPHMHRFHAHTSTTDLFADRIASALEASRHGPAVILCLPVVLHLLFGIGLVVTLLQALGLLLTRRIRGGTDGRTGDGTDGRTTGHVPRLRDGGADGRTRQGADGRVMSGRRHRHDAPPLVRGQGRATGIETRLLHGPQVARVAVAVLLFGALALFRIEIHPGGGRRWRAGHRLGHGFGGACAEHQAKHQCTPTAAGGMDESLIDHRHRISFGQSPAHGIHILPHYSDCPVKACAPTVKECKAQPPLSRK